MTGVVANRIRLLSDQLGPIKEYALRCLDGGNVDPATGALQLSPRAGIPPHAYALMLFPGIDAAVLAKYQARFHVQIPLTYAKVLAEMNGANLFELRLFGLPPSLLQDPPLIDRSVIQPLDLATANHSWKTKYGPPAGDFFVGSGPDGDQDRFGYFLSQEGSVASYGLGGKRVAHWPSFSEFLASELQRAEHRFPGFEQMHVALREQRHP